MNFEQNRIELVPRNVSNCLDLAWRICGRTAGTLFGLWVLFAVPLGVLTWYAARSTLWGFPVMLLLGWFGSAPFGVMLTAGMARMTFGEEFTLPKMLSSLQADATSILRVCLLRVPLALATMLCLIPGALLGLRWSFLVENQVLAELHESRHDRRTTELIHLEFSDLAFRGFVIVLMGGIFWILTEWTVDVVWTVLFGRSLMIGRLHELGSMQYDPEHYLQQAWLLFWSDPAVLVLHLTTGLAVYAVCRVAWFLCYIDLRVRRDCWDLELEILQETRRVNADYSTRGTESRL